MLVSRLLVAEALRNVTEQPPNGGSVSRSRFVEERGEWVLHNWRDGLIPDE
jgi:hypothetical protein